MTKNPQFPIIGVGASAGGVEALEGFFQGVSADPGVGIVVVTHLNPERESVLHEIIARYTQLTVQVAVDGAEVQPNCVYVLPADAILGISKGHLQVRKSDIANRERKPIDIFLSALAKDQGECSGSIILAGEFAGRIANGIDDDMRPKARAVSPHTPALSFEFSLFRRNL
jgi:two-component system, chemotaxis family, CheB/CheR fusion protein